MRGEDRKCEMHAFFVVNNFHKLTLSSPVSLSVKKRHRKIEIVHFELVQVCYKYSINVILFSSCVAE